MKGNLHTTFKNAKHHPEMKLGDDIWRTIVAQEERRARLGLWMYGFLSIASFTALFPVVNTLILRFTQSGFYQYLSLAFSDSGIIASAWKEFAMLLADSLPASNLLLSLTLLFIFLYSFKRIARQFTNPFKAA